MRKKKAKNYFIFLLLKRQYQCHRQKDYILTNLHHRPLPPPPLLPPLNVVIPAHWMISL